MTWFKVDDSFYDHPKVFDAPDCAVALWTRAGTWSARNLTEGFVPAGMPARLCDDPDTAIRELVRRGLWSRVKDGYRFHDWDVYQPSAEAVAALKQKRAAAGRAGGLARAANQTASKRQASARPDAKQSSTPTRPGPFLVPRKEGAGARASPAIEPPCGGCDEHRQVEVEGRVRRCPACHPLRTEAS